MWYLSTICFALFFHTNVHNVQSLISSKNSNSVFKKFKNWIEYYINFPSNHLNPLILQLSTIHPQNTVQQEGAIAVLNDCSFCLHLIVASTSFTTSISLLMAIKNEATALLGKKICLLSCMISGGDFMLPNNFFLAQLWIKATDRSEKYDFNVQMFMRKNSHSNFPFFFWCFIGGKYLHNIFSVCSLRVCSVTLLAMMLAFFFWTFFFYHFLFQFLFCHGVERKKNLEWVVCDYFFVAQHDKLLNRD